MLQCQPVCDNEGDDGPIQNDGDTGEICFLFLVEGERERKSEREELHCLGFRPRSAEVESRSSRGSAQPLLEIVIAPVAVWSEEELAAERLRACANCMERVLRPVRAGGLD